MCTEERHVTDIVVIEQDELMRNLIVEWLTAEGYAVAAGSAADMARVRCNLLIVDLPAPRDTGSGTIHALRRPYPHAPVIATSASFRAGLPAEGSAAQALGVARVLPKPFSLAELLAAVRAVVGPPR